jgi:hypothetical protein
MPKPVALGSSSHHICPPIKLRMKSLVRCTGALRSPFWMRLFIAARQPYVNVARCHDASSYWREHPFRSTKEPVYPKEIALYAQKQI